MKGYTTQEDELNYLQHQLSVNSIELQISPEEEAFIRASIKEGVEKGIYAINNNKFSFLITALNTVLIVITEIGLKKAAVIANLLYRPAFNNIITIDQIKQICDPEVADIVKGLMKINHLEANRTTLESENFIKLLLSFAEDMRVILIMIANRLYLMRTAFKSDETTRLKLAIESSYIYIPLAHKLGLYNIKSELEDLYLKYTDRHTYDYISRKLNESKVSRDQYISEFISPLEEKLKETGLKYDIKGRVKSIFSINNKLKKQKVEFESIYDLFAIRIILDSPVPKEKAECWQIYSIVTDLYQPNPKRLKDWLSIPKSNGYESLHITVMGPQSRWVEVQIRTRRMDEIAERGLAAHWKYKGVKSESNIDDWLSTLRETLENKGIANNEKLEDFKLDIYDDEIYVFTPKGDLHKLPKGATVLDFAFSIHTKLGITCVSGKVNGKNVSIRHKLNSGDQIEIMTSANQTPKQDWLNFVTTTKAKNKIRQKLKEEANKQVDYAKEQLKRRFKNRKIDEDEGILMRLIKKLGFKTVTDFYIKIAQETLDVNSVIDQYLELEKREADIHDKHELVSAESYTIQNPNTTQSSDRSTDELILDKDLKGIDYTLAKCCNPIYGDEVFGFISSQGIKIHRTNCPNAHDMFSRFGYRVIPARWSGKSGSSYTIILRVVGADDIGIVTNLTSIISKEQGITLRSISIDSNDGLFQGNLSVTLQDTNTLESLMKKLRTVKGVKQISRLN